jgi:hypothetical protein
VCGAFRQATGILAENRPFSEPRLELIAKTPALRERDLAKAASMAEALGGALKERGVAARLADLAAQAGWAAFHQAVDAWIDEPGSSLDAQLAGAFDNLRVLFAAAG